MRVLITGASGFVGRHLVAALRNGLNSPVVLARGAPSGGAVEEAVGPKDLSEIETWDGWPRDIGAVVHLAALNPARGARPSPESLRHANAVTTAALARRARREGVGRFVLLGTANVHRAGVAAPIGEDAPIEPQSAYAASKREAETMLWEALAGGKTTGCVLRPVPVYGRGSRGAIAALARLARSPFPLPVGGLGGARSILAVDHLVEAILTCLDAPGAANETFLVADGEPLTFAAMVRALRLGWGRRPGVFALPGPVPAGLTAALGRAGPLRSLLAPFEVDTRRLEARTGWRRGDDAFERLRRMAADGEI